MREAKIFRLAFVVLRLLLHITASLTFSLRLRRWSIKQKVFLSSFSFLPLLGKKKYFFFTLQRKLLITLQCDNTEKFGKEEGRRRRTISQDGYANKSARRRNRQENIRPEHILLGTSCSLASLSCFDIEKEELSERRRKKKRNKVEKTISSFLNHKKRCGRMRDAEWEEKKNCNIDITTDLKAKRSWGWKTQNNNGKMWRLSRSETEEKNEKLK